MRALAVNSHQVVCRDDPSDWRSAGDTGVRAMLIVVVQPACELATAIVGVPIEARFP
jgi:hypothetical protein